MIYVVIPVFENLFLTKNLISSIGDKDGMTLIIVDDNPNRLHETYAKDCDFVYITGDGSNFWGGSINLGLEYIYTNSKSDTDNVVLLNNDVTLNFTLKDFVKVVGNNVGHPQCYDNKSGRLINSCGRLLLWFPFLIRYPKLGANEFTAVDILTGRCLVMNLGTIKLAGGIDKNLPHYLGDSNLGLVLNKLGVVCNLYNRYSVDVDNTQTGIIRSGSNLTLKNVLFDVKSAYNLEHRWTFVRNHNSFFLASLILVSMYVKFVLRIIKRAL